MIKMKMKIENKLSYNHTHGDLLVQMLIIIFQIICLERKLFLIFNTLK